MFYLDFFFNFPLHYQIVSQFLFIMLGKCEIKRQEFKVKKIKKMSGFFNFGRNIHQSPHIF
jgi:hypothetical protein